MTRRALPIVLGAAILAGNSAALADQAAIPLAMRGGWGWDAKSCANQDNDGRVAVTENRVNFYASTLSTERVMSRNGGGTVEIDGLEQEEESGTRVRGSLELRLLSPDRLQIDRTNHVYLRCSP